MSFIDFGFRISVSASGFATHVLVFSFTYYWSHPLLLGPNLVDIAAFAIVFMKILLRNTQTGLFYVAPDQWTSNHPEAFDFGKTDLALNAVRDGKLKGIELLVHFDNPAFEIPMTIVDPGQPS